MKIRWKFSTREQVSLFVVTESNPYWLLTSPAPASVHRTRCGRVSINNQSVARCSALHPGQGQTGSDLEQILRNPPSTCLSVSVTRMSSDLLGWHNKVTQPGLVWLPRKCQFSFSYRVLLYRYNPADTENSNIKTLYGFLGGIFT